MGKSLDDKKLEEAVQAMYSGSLGAKIKKNSSYVITGMFIGGVAGLMIASFMGKSKLWGAVIGAGVSGIGGYIVSNNTKNKEDE